LAANEAAAERRPARAAATLLNAYGPAAFNHLSHPSVLPDRKNPRQQEKPR